MFKRQVALLTALGLAAILGLLSPATAVAETADAPAKPAAQIVLPVEDVTAAGSPVCSATYSHGKIRYQVCIRYNCDSTRCWVRGYFGLVNTATGPRNVDWWLFRTYSDAPDGNGEVPLAAGQQKTTLAPEPRLVPCNVWDREGLEIDYDSGPHSPRIYVEVFLPCV